MNCPSCNKFASLEMSDPELDSLEVEHTPPGEGETIHTYVVTGSVRIVRTSACCGDEMKEANFDLETNVEIETSDLPKGVDPSKCEVEEREVDSTEEGGGRYAKSFYGASVHGVVVLGHVGETSKDTELEWHWEDKIAASAMDELV